jgi:hypothetical protein
MPKVEVMEFDKVTRKFTFLAKVDFPAIPAYGDKVICRIAEEDFIFKVYDVHYFSTNSVVRVNIIRLQYLEDYNSSGFGDILYY